MTQRRNNRDAISNYFDELERGIGKRGSSFTDIDGVSHDRDGDRILFREFKHDGERLDKYQRETLAALARLPNCTVWFLRKIGSGQIGFAQFGSGKLEQVISESDYRRRLAEWWRTGASRTLDIPPPVSRQPTFERLILNDPGPTAW